MDILVAGIISIIIGIIIGYAVSKLKFKNIKKKQTSIEKQAFTDPLTGGKNRYLFMFDLDKLINKNKKFAVCFMDLDGFKQINDTMGHDAGDELLIGLSNTFLEKLPQNVTSYRIGGDELVIICPDIDKNLFELKLQQALNVLEASSYTVSMGVVYSKFVDNLPKMIKEANIKMKRSKETFRKAHPEKYLNKYEVTYVGDEQDNLKKSY